MPEESPRLHVLIVDDEPLIRWSLAATLRDDGDFVTEAESAETAIRALTSQPEPDVILLDYHLPDSRDLQLLSDLRHMAPATQVILMTAHWTRQLAKDAIAMGAYDVVSKPIDVRDLGALVHGAAASREDASGDAHEHVRDMTRTP